MLIFEINKYVQTLFTAINQCISPLRLWVRIPFKCTRYNIMW